jgi:hypothetical protein
VKREHIARVEQFFLFVVATLLFFLDQSADFVWSLVRVKSSRVQVWGTYIIWALILRRFGINTLFSIIWILVFGMANIVLCRYCYLRMILWMRDFEWLLEKDFDIGNSGDKQVLDIIHVNIFIAWLIDWEITWLYFKELL